MGDLINDYTRFVEVMEDILNSRSEKPKVVVIYFNADWASLDKGLYRKLNQVHAFLDKRHGCGVIRLLKVSVDSLKEIMSIFDLKSYPTVFVLRPDLSVVAKLTLEEVMGGHDEVLEKFNKLWESETQTKPTQPALETEKFTEVLNDYISDVVKEIGETSADPRPNILEYLRQLKTVISEIQNENEMDD